jgi:3-oxoacyl-[acyl-carrier protein] reductase
MTTQVSLTPGQELSGKVILITGGARNIGRAIARSVAAGGANVMINALGSHAEVDATVAAIQTAGGTAAGHLADVTDPKAVAAMVAATIARFGRIDALVNNAAVRPEKPFGEMSFDDWRRVLAVVLDGAFLCSHACLPHLVRAGGGSIVNIGGETGHRGAAGRAHVVTAKAGLAGMTKALALDLAPRQITVNCVVPGRIDTHRALPGVPGQAVHRPAVPPIGRLGLPEEVAAIVRMLCGPEARYITGQAIHVNGGGFMP